MKRNLLLVIAMMSFISMNSFAKDEEPGFKADVILDTTSTLSGKAINLPQGADVKIEAHLVEIKPGAEVGKHKHPYPVVMYVLDGTLVVEEDDGTKKTYQAGDAFIEDANTWVNNKNPGTVPMKFLAVLIGKKESPSIEFQDNQ